MHLEAVAVILSRQHCLKQPQKTAMSDQRQRFFIEQSPVRGDVVHLQTTLHTILRQRPYPKALGLLLGEMLTAAALLASTIKIRGRLSIQAQGQGALKWAMAECSDQGELRGLLEYAEDADWDATAGSAEALAALDGGVLFINIEPEGGERYQGIVAMDQPTLAECLTAYYQQSAQTPTHIMLGCDGHTAGGLLIQQLPRSRADEQAGVDDDLWPRLTLLTRTLTGEELCTLSASDLLHRLYHEEEVRLPQPEALRFGCTCSRQRCEAALLQVGRDQVEDILREDAEIRMDCQFCNSQYRFGTEEALALFGVHVS